MLICNILGLLTSTLKCQFSNNPNAPAQLMSLDFPDCTLDNKDWCSFQMRLFYSALLIPFRGYSYTTKKKKTLTAVQHILAESLK